MKNLSISGVYQIDETTVKKALQCLIDNGIDADEAAVVLQALGYILMDVELEPLMEV